MNFGAILVILVEWGGHDVSSLNRSSVELQFLIRVDHTTQYMCIHTAVVVLRILQYTNLSNALEHVYPLRLCLQN